MNWLATLISFLERFWPLAQVEQWEIGTYYILGRAMKWQLKPGWLYPIIPWFTRVETVSVVPHPLSTPLLNITLSDGRTLGYSATAIVSVFDPWLALNAIDDYEESTTELIASKTSEFLAQEDADRLNHSRRGRLINSLINEANKELNEYGVMVSALRFTNFALEQRTYRLLTDSAVMSMSF
jgi:regulator of protease activity HflC (stomatin/prohibitin superfamily)